MQTPPVFSDAKVLGQPGAIDLVERVVRVMAKQGFAAICDNDCNFRDVIGNVAADWISRLLRGDAQVRYFGHPNFTAANLYTYC